MVAAVATGVALTLTAGPAPAKPLGGGPAPASRSTAGPAPASGSTDAPTPGALAPDGRAVNAVVAWNEHAGDAALASCLAPGNHPPFEARMYAITQLAVHDALNAIKRKSRPYAFHGRAAAGASPKAAVAAAASTALSATIADLPPELGAECVTEGRASVAASYAASLDAIPDGPAKTRGARVGRRAAAALLETRADDGSDTAMVVADHPQGTQPGQWRFTPGTDFAFAPGWGAVDPFALRAADQFPAAPPYPLSSAAYARDVDEVRRLGGDGVSTPTARTPQQTETAHFWLESSPLAWNRIGRTLAVKEDLGLWRSARLLGLLDAALADGYIASFHTKYAVHRFWRPVTAIRLADTDANPATDADPTWTPLVTTPPIPDHESAHAVQGAAAAAVFRRFFATDRLPFAACSYTVAPESSCTGADPVLRRYRSPSQAAAENGASRVLIGFHFRRAVDVGLRHGSHIGRWTSRRLLKPVR